METHQDLVFGVAYKVLGDPCEAEDAAQEAFLRMFRALPGYRGECAFATWLFRIAVSAAVDQGRHRRRLSRGAADPSAGLPRLAVGPEVTVEQTERCRDVLRAMAELRPALRGPLVLREVYGLPYEEIGVLLGRRLGTVKAAVHRGRAAVAAALDGGEVTG
ncbi:MAG: RNA polymerase sigma factor [Actinobacteria bacterium]|nr:RNA polymerase sigma factor [Actinomycetota bacterium]